MRRIKDMKKLIAVFTAVIMLTMIFAGTAFAAVTAGEERAVIAEDISDEEIDKVYKDFGIERGSVKELTVTNQDERAYLEGLVSEKKIGNVAISCVYIKTLEEGEGTNITVMNINWCTEDMYKNALQTAGITDADVIITAPRTVSGTAALTGIYKAYEDITGEKLKEDNKEAAAEELVVTGTLAESIGSEQAAELVKQLKEILDKTSQMTDDEVRDQIRTIAVNINVTLTDEQVEQLLSLVRSLEKLDIAGLTETVNSVGSWFTDIGSAISGFFKSIGDWFAGLFG